MTRNEQSERDVDDVDAFTLHLAHHMTVDARFVRLRRYAERARALADTIEREVDLDAARLRLFARHLDIMADRLDGQGR